MSRVSYGMRQGAIFTVMFFSGLFKTNQLRACRFHPSCSVYSCGAFKNFDFFHALILTVKRISKCHPFSPGGYDPLPLSRQGEI